MAFLNIKLDQDPIFINAFAPFTKLPKSNTLRAGSVSTLVGSIHCKHGLITTVNSSMANGNDQFLIVNNDNAYIVWIYMHIGRIKRVLSSYVFVFAGMCSQLSSGSRVGSCQLRVCLRCLAKWHVHARSVWFRLCPLHRPILLTATRWTTNVQLRKLFTMLW